jgi:hypothetical protein
VVILSWHYIVVLINYHPVGGEIDFLICKLAQKGRAAGIHLILESSKTPSSRICVNFPARLIGSGTLEMAKGNRFAENAAGLFYFCGKKCEKVKLL